MPILCDTNVLLRSAQPQHPDYPAAVQAIERAAREGREPVVFLQNLAEFWNVATRPRQNNGLGYSIHRTSDEIERLTESVFILPDHPLTADIWRSLVLKYEVRGVQVHDARLVAGTIAHGIRETLTFNAEDFHRYAEIPVTTPA